MLVENLIKSGKATIVDVRTPDEFLFGNVKGSINIPLNTIENNFSKLKSLQTPIVFCCASGNRSSIATILLQRHNFEEVYNGGSWIYVNNILKNKS